MTIAVSNFGSLATYTLTLLLRVRVRVREEEEEGGWRRR